MYGRSDEMKELIIKVFEYFGIQLCKSSYFSGDNACKVVYPTGSHMLRPSKKVIDDVMGFYGQIDPFYHDKVRDELRIGGAWRNNLEINRRRQLKAIYENDHKTYEELLSNMFRNEMIYAMWDIKYYESNEPKKTPMAYKVWLDAFKYITGRPEEDLVVSSIGNPWGCKTVNGGVIKFIDPVQGIKAQSIVNVLSLLNSEESYGTDGGRKLTLMDLGSGFGGDVEKVARWYKGALKVVLVDIPVNLTTAYAYISSCFPDARKKLVSSLSQLDVVSESNDENIEFIFVPTCFVESLKGMPIDVLHNHGSFSEMDFETIKLYFDVLLPMTTYLHEINSNKSAYLSDSHQEVNSFSFPVPETHQLVTRGPTWYTPRGHRYLFSLYKKLTSQQLDVKDDVKN